MTDKDAVLKKTLAAPNGYHSITSWVIANDTAGLIRFMKEAFDAEEIPGTRFYNSDGSIGHVEVRIGDAVVMMFDSKENWPATPAFLRLYVTDADEVWRRAVEAGAVSVTEVASHFFGDRIGRVRDPAGNVWWIQTHDEDVGREEMGRRINGTNEFTEAMREAQESLDRELRSRRRA